MLKDYGTPISFNIINASKQIEGSLFSSMYRYECCTDQMNFRFILVMEYAQHGSLHDLMAEKHVLDESEACIYFHQLANALDFCHSKHIAHRDLKLENLLLSDNNRLKVGDFGFARYFNVDDPTTALSSTFCGSNAYVSPEILHQYPYDPLSADVWACGVVLFAMVFGNLPFDDSASIRQLTMVQLIICYDFT